MHFFTDFSMMNKQRPQATFMELAIAEAVACRQFAEHPVGAVVVRGKEILSRSGNRTHRDLNPTHHAEVVAIGLAARRLGRKNLNDCWLYTTHEPCPMCAAACMYAKMSGMVFGTSIADAVSFVASHPQARWRSIGISVETLLKSGDQPHLVVIEGFLKKQCLALFDLLLPT